MRNCLCPRLAAQSIRNNRQFFLPYLLTIIGSSAALYIMTALARDPGVSRLRGAQYVQSMMLIGMFVATLFTLGVLLYTNSFLMKRRKKELGLYNVLGMGKRHIALILCLESLYIGVSGIGLGLAAGVLLHKLATLALYRLLTFEVPFGFALSVPALIQTAAVFAVLLMITLLTNLFRVRVSRPIELLRGGSMGEREPKTRWLLTLVGVVSLGGGYAIAVSTRDSFSALAVYFLAVLLVIIGTFCLFTAVSIFVLKLLRRSRRFYYKTAHFIGVSGMLFRMKQNAVGLANICILSTMVMVMLSGTLSLYLGIGETIDARVPADLVAEVRYDPRAEEPFLPEKMEQAIAGYLEQKGLPVERVRTVQIQPMNVLLVRGGFSLDLNLEGTHRTIWLVTAEDYAALTGNPAPALSAGQVAMTGGGTLPAEVTFYSPEEEIALTVTEELAGTAAFSAALDAGDALCLAVADDQTLDALYQLQARAYDVPQSMRWLALYDLDCEDSQALALREEFFLDNVTSRAAAGQWERMSLDIRAEERLDGYAMSGGFLFLGILLSAIFLMATVLIIYYKQVSEGYEDRERYEIMQKVGLTPAEVRSTIRSQVLLVFFLPIAVASVHILFDFNLVVQLLALFSLENVPLTGLCTLGTVLVFFGVYGVVYALTARTYYRIVSRKA